MLSRRALVCGGLALALPSHGYARTTSDPKRATIDALPLPAGFTGVIAYGRSGMVEHIRCVGMADRETSTPITPATQFKCGSASKWLSSTAVLRLADQRRLKLDVPITTYLPEFRRTTGAQVTLLHLLSNTSGIPDLLTRQIATEPELRRSTMGPADIVARFAGGDLAFAPGTGWDYSALNWVIVAAIVERITGQTFADAVASLVFQPLGMADTGFAQIGSPAMPRLAAAYANTVPPARKMPAAPAFVAATGNVATTVADAIRAADSIFDRHVLSATSRRALTSVRWPEQEYALGGRVHLIDGEQWGWEAGKVGGYRALIAHRLGRRETVVVFNTSDMEQQAIGQGVEAIARA